MYTAVRIRIFLFPFRIFEVANGIANRKPAIPNQKNARQMAHGVDSGKPEKKSAPKLTKTIHKTTKTPTTTYEPIIILH